MGAAYLAAFVLEFLGARETIWARARVAVPAVLVFTVLTLVATLLHIDKFHFGPEFSLLTQAGTWVWLLIYAIVPVGMVVFKVRFEGNLFSLLAGITLGACAFFALGYALVGLVPSARAVVVIGNVVLYPLMIFSGAMVPLEVMPDMVLTISRYLPLTHLVALLRGLWFGTGWGDLLTEVAVLAGVAIVGTLIVARTFRWE